MLLITTNMDFLWNRISNYNKLKYLGRRKTISAAKYLRLKQIHNRELYIFCIYNINKNGEMNGNLVMKEYVYVSEIIQSQIIFWTRINFIKRIVFEKTASNAKRFWATVYTMRAFGWR